MQLYSLYTMDKMNHKKQEARSINSTIYKQVHQLATYSTAQMQLHSEAQVSSKALKGLLKVTRY